VGYESVLWRRLDRPGHEACRLFERPPGWHLSGAAVIGHNGKACRLDYAVVCDALWRTRRGRVTGFVGEIEIEVDVSVDANGRWTLNGVECPEVEGCIDLDLNFSASTNLLPIRRLALEVGQDAAIRAAWLRFPAFVLEPLHQVYRRTAAGIYRYESAFGRFKADLHVNEAGLVTRYPGFCEIDARAW
jgi:hypothetical protein